MTRITIVWVLVALVACSKKKEQENRGPTQPGASADAAAAPPPPPADAAEPDAAAPDEGSGSGSAAAGPDAAKFEEHAGKSSNDFAKCYEQSTKTEAAKLKDVKSVDVRVTIGGAGKVDAVQYTGLPVGTKLEGCMNKVIRAWKVPEVKAGSYQFTLTPPE